MFYIVFATGGFVWVIALFKRELLARRRSFRIILGLSIVLFSVGVMLHLKEARYPASGALLAPLVSLGLYRLCRAIFIRHFKREPRDTWLNWAEGMSDDRLFNIVYFVLAGWIWALLAGFMS